MNENDTKSEIEDKDFIRTFRENSSGAIFQFPVIGLMPISIKLSTDWFAKTLRQSLYKVSCEIPMTGIDLPKIEIDIFEVASLDPRKIVVLPWGMDGTEYCTGVDEKGILVQIELSSLFNKNLFTEVHDKVEDPSIKCTSELKNDLTKFMNIKDDKNKSTPDNSGSISDGYHTFDELYYYRMLYNAMAVNMLHRYKMIPVFKSKKHHDGKPCFDGRYFIVQMVLPTGYVANHYELKYWDLFKVSEQERAPYEYDGSTPAEEAERIHEYIEQWNTLY